MWIDSFNFVNQSLKGSCNAASYFKCRVSKWVCNFQCIFRLNVDNFLWFKNLYINNDNINTKVSRDCSNFLKYKCQEFHCSWGRSVWKQVSPFEEEESLSPEELWLRSYQQCLWVQLEIAMYLLICSFSALLMSFSHSPASPCPNLSYQLGTSENILAQYFSQGGKFRSSYFKIYFLGRIMELL